jgi:hypothetical protein
MIIKHIRQYRGKTSLKITKDKSKLAYLAALLDGEGYFCISKTLILDRNKNPYPAFDLQIGVSNTSEKLMKWLVSTFGQSYRPLSQRTNTFAKKVCYQWRMERRENQEKFILAILPYLVIKREQAKVALQYIRLPRTAPDDRMELHIRMKSLNKPESVTTNTSSTPPGVKIESVLTGDIERVPTVT